MKQPGGSLLGEQREVISSVKIAAQVCFTSLPTGVVVYMIYCTPQANTVLQRARITYFKPMLSHRGKYIHFTVTALAIGIKIYTHFSTSLMKKIGSQMQAIGYHLNTAMNENLVQIAWNDTSSATQLKHKLFNSTDISVIITFFKCL